MDVEDDKLQETLLKLPRRDYAKAQGMEWFFIVNGYTVTRITRRFWSIGGRLLKLADAVKRLEVPAY